MRLSHEPLPSHRLRGVKAKKRCKIHTSSQNGSKRIGTISKTQLKRIYLDSNQILNMRKKLFATLLGVPLFICSLAFSRNFNAACSSVWSGDTVACRISFRSVVSLRERKNLQFLIGHSERRARNSKEIWKYSEPKRIRWIALGETKISNLLFRTRVKTLNSVISRNYVTFHMS